MLTVFTLFPTGRALSQSKEQRLALLAYLQFSVGTKMVERCSGRFPEYRELSASVLAAWSDRHRAQIERGRQLARAAAERGEVSVDQEVERRYQATITEFAQMKEADARLNCEAAMREFEMRE